MMTDSEEMTEANGYIAGIECFVVGKDAVALGFRSVAWGDGAYANGDRAVAVGPGAHAEGDNAVAIGPQARATAGEWVMSDRGFAAKDFLLHLEEVRRAFHDLSKRALPEVGPEAPGPDPKPFI